MNDGAQLIRTYINAMTSDIEHYRKRIADYEARREGFAAIHNEIMAEWYAGRAAGKQAAIDRIEPDRIILLRILEILEATPWGDA